MQSFIEGKITADDIIDIKSAAKTYALLMSWSGKQAFALNNIRWYYNPIVRKFERIAYDEDIETYSDNYSSIFTAELFNNTAFIKDVYKNLLELEKRYQTQDAKQTYKADLDYMMQLATGDKLLYNQDKKSCEHFEVNKDTARKVCEGTNQWVLDNIQKLKEKVKSRLNGNMYPLNVRHQKITPEDCSILVKKAQPYWVLQSGKPYVRVVNISCEAVQLHKISYKNKKQIKEKDVNITIQPDLVDYISDGVLIPVSEFGVWNHKNTTLELTYSDAQGAVYTQPVNVGAMPIQLQALPDVTELWRGMNGVTIGHDTIVIDKNANITIDQEVVVPETHMLQVNGGAKIDIINGALLRAKGKVRFAGTTQDKVSVSVSSGYDGENRSLWGGLLFLNDTIIENALFTGNSMVFKNRQDVRGLTSCVTVYKADVTITDTIFSNLQCEDSLNVFSGHIDMKRVEINNSLADALDSDFSTGTVEDSRFIDIGNDALDFSGSQVTLKNITAINIGDKGISGGEDSQITAMGIVVDNAGYAIASKDKSTVKVSDLETSKIRTAVFGAYIKKAEYGVGTIIADGVINKDDNPLTECQEGNIILINNEQQTCYQERIDTLPTQVQNNSGKQ